jgi:DNA polymerase-1
VVAAEADDDLLLKAFRAGLDVHSMNAEMVFGSRWSTAKGDPKNKSTPRGRLRDDCKRATHGTNYGAHFRTIASTLGWTQHEAELFQRTWFHLHPGIRTWHDRTADSLRATRSVSNRFGYRIIYYDRIDSLLPEALAWIPQSTVALTTFYGAKAIDDALNAAPGIERVEWLLQVHDSLVFQIRTDALASVLPVVDKLLRVPIPYDRPLTIPWKIGTSTRSWHHCEPWERTPT